MSVLRVLIGPQSGSIDGPILSTFYTNLVVLPAVMEYMQYGFIALGVAIVIIAALVHHGVKVTPRGDDAWCRPHGAWCRPHGADRMALSGSALGGS